MSASAYTLLENQFAGWCLDQSEIVAAIVVGSRGRAQDADDYSDLDLILFTTDTENLISGANWISYFSTPWLTFLDQKAGQDPEWFVVTDGGLKLDILLRQVTLPGNLNEWLLQFPYQDVLARGFRVLFDKSETQDLLPATRNQGLPEIEFPFFQNSRKETLLSILRAAKFAYRGEIWRSQREIAQIRESLLKFYEWQAYLESDGLVDTWYSGRRIGEWLDQSALDKLPKMFPSFNQTEVLNSMLVILRELNRVSEEIVKLTDFPAPTHGLMIFQSWLEDFIRTGSQIEGSPIVLESRD